MDKEARSGLRHSKIIIIKQDTGAEIGAEIQRQDGPSRKWIRCCMQKASEQVFPQEALCPRSST